MNPPFAKAVANGWRTALASGTRSAVRHPTGGWRLAHAAASYVGSGGERLANEREQLDIDDELESWEEWFASLPPVPPGDEEDPA
jgi:hypothetical protein